MISQSTFTSPTLSKRAVGANSLSFGGKKTIGSVSGHHRHPNSLPKKDQAFHKSHNAKQDLRDLPFPLQVWLLAQMIILGDNNKRR